MNILPKKRWHVRTKENIERVRRDEEQAAEEEKERQRRIALAEQEARIDVLRSRVRKEITNESEEGGGHQVQIYNKDQHVNLFKDLEEGKKTKQGNKEYEEEKKAEKEKQEKSIGLLTYLGQSAIESQKSKPWYFQPPEKRSKTEEPSASTSGEREKEEFEIKKKASVDPMKDMVKYLDAKKKKKKKDKEREKEYEKKRKLKHKDRYRDKEKGKSSNGGKTIEQLRAERLKRERGERQKSQELLARLRGENVPKKEETITDERQMRYNSQFNPDLARVRKPKHKDDNRYF